MDDVDANRLLNFDRSSHHYPDIGCGNAGGGTGNGRDTPGFAHSIRKASPFDDFQGDLPILSSYLPKSQDGSAGGLDPELRDVLRKLINWLPDAKKTGNAEGTFPAETTELQTLLAGDTRETAPQSNGDKRIEGEKRDTKSVSPEQSTTTKVKPDNGSTETERTAAEEPVLSRKGEVIVVDQPIIVDGGVFDGKGATYTASSKLGDGSQAEGQQPIFILKNGATLKNVDLSENGADGIHVYSGATIENVNWLDVGEDALTVKSAGDVNIIGGSARGATDKIFQVNADSTIHIKDFDADGFTSLVRTNGGKQLDIDLTIEGGNFSNGANLFRTDSSTASVTFLGDIALDNVKNWKREGDRRSGV
ncbi:pectate lyase [Rhizobium sp. TRM95111]|uniref:pectate lyase n=1 Tax=Rhizobium alarense TaxID=2846851 RepID=UPI001F2BF75F|nr:pectate lyase [Rhizobium alarense]MCF3641589.1 pectate lyase [Rhizobium alarense]